MIIENSASKWHPDFEHQLVRLVRTEWSAGLSQPITFEGLDTEKVIDENEVVVLLPEAIRFVIDLDEKEESLQVSR